MPLHPTPRSTNSHGQPVEQIGMRWRRALHAKIVLGLDQSAAKKRLPIAIHRALAASAGCPPRQASCAKSSRVGVSHAPPQAEARRLARRRLHGCRGPKSRRDDARTFRAAQLARAVPSSWESSAPPRGARRSAARPETLAARAVRLPEVIFDQLFVFLVAASELHVVCNLHGARQSSSLLGRDRRLPIRFVLPLSPVAAARPRLQGA